MILCGILGFDDWSYTDNAKWALNVYTDADAAGLFEDVTGDYGTAATRGDCFTMLYNALFFETTCDGLGLAYVKEYDVEELYLTKGTGANDNPYVYEVAEGIYTEDSFTAKDAGASITLYQYVADTTTGKGVLNAAYSVNLDADEGEAYFFVEVECKHGTVWYKFVPGADWSYFTGSVVVVANEYADLYGTEPLKAGKTEVMVKNQTFVIDASTTLDDLGLTFDLATLTSVDKSYAVKSLTKSEKNDVRVITSKKEYEDATRGPAALKVDKAEKFIDFAQTNETTDYYEIVKNFTVTEKDEDGEDKEVAYKIGQDEIDNKYITEDVLKALYEAGATDSNKYTFAKWLANYAEVTDVDLNEKFEAPETGYVVKFVDNNADGTADYALKLTYTGVASVADRGPDAPKAIGNATEFAGVKFGGDDGKSVSLRVDIDGVTYITTAETEILTVKKDTDFDSEIATKEMRKFLVCDNLNPDG